MKKIRATRVFVLAGMMMLINGCERKPYPPANTKPIAPRFVSARVHGDSDDPAIWLHPTDRSQSLILGTDKGDSEPGALYVFDLQGKMMADKVVGDLSRPNNVDVEYGLPLQGVLTDIAVTTQKYENKVRVHALPEMRAIDNGGVEVFAGVAKVEPMGIALYKRAHDGTIFMIVGRKKGPQDGSYLWQYRLEDDGSGSVRAVKVREFGKWSGRGEIEAVAVDDAMGYVYYADEWAGIRKYHADPDVPDANRELACFGTKGFKEDREGISIYAVSANTGYVLVSDQQANTFHFYKREGEPNAPHDHRLVKVLKLSTEGSDGSEVTNLALGEPFEHGLFVAMSEKGVFHFYAWSDLAAQGLLVTAESAN